MKKQWHLYPGWATTKEIFNLFTNISETSFYEFGYTKQFPYQEINTTADITIGYSLGCLNALQKSLLNQPEALILVSPFLSFTNNDIKIIKQLKAMKLSLKQDTQTLVKKFHNQASFPDKNLFTNYNDWQTDTLLKGIDDLLNINISNLNFNKLICPILIIQGKDDTINSLAKVQQVQDRLPHSQLEIITGGHSILLNHSDKCLEIIKKFLQKNEII